MLKDTDVIEQKWTEGASSFLVGKTVRRVQYLTRKNADEMMWSSRPLFIEFTDGSHVFAVSDDEGNDSVALGTSSEELPTIPTLGM